MQKIWTLTFIAAGFLTVAGISGPSVADKLPVDKAALSKCFAEPDRLDRLGCYDQLLGRPGIADSAASASSASDQQSDTVRPRAVAYVDGFLNSPVVTKRGVHVSLIDRKSGQPLTGNYETEDGRIDLLSGATSADRLQRETDVFLALANFDGEQNGVLLVSCENNITRMRVMWDTPFDGTTISARFLFGNKLSGGPNIERVLRVGGNGYLLESARGLESIRLLRNMVTGDRVQISAGRAGELRSLFFDAGALRDALPMVGQHCSWKVASR